MKSIIRRFSGPTEFLLVIFISFGITIAGTLIWLIHAFAATALPAAPIRLTNASIIEGIIFRITSLALVLWIGSIRGWSLTTFGFRPSWKAIGGGVLLFAVFLLIQQVVGFITREVFHGTVNFHRIIELTLPFIILICIVNPMFEEALECGYFFQALQLWPTNLG